MIQSSDEITTPEISFKPSKKSKRSRKSSGSKCFRCGDCCLLLQLMAISNPSHNSISQLVFALGFFVARERFHVEERIAEILSQNEVIQNFTGPPLERPGVILAR
jgi:hypothetical protein